MGRRVKKQEFRAKGGVTVIGEGICEQYYLNSIKGMVNSRISPQIVKDGIENLIKEVERCISEGVDNVYCLIDMDNKGGEKVRKEYESFYKKYHDKTFMNKIHDTETKVYIIANQPCLEIWLLYYFKYTTAQFCSYEKLEPLKPELISYLPNYEKSKKFLESTRGLHDYVVSKNGDFNTALINSIKSIKDSHDGKCNAFSEMAILFDKILKSSEKTRLKLYIEAEDKIRKKQEEIEKYR